MVSDTARHHRPRRVVIVDNQAAFAERLRLALDGVDDLECVGTTSTSAAAYALVERTGADLVVVDLMLRGGTAPPLLRRLRRSFPDIAIVVTSTSADVGKLMGATVAGANGVAPKKGALEELLSVLRSARPGVMAIAPSLLPAGGTAGHIRSTHGKLGVRTPQAAVVRAQQTGLLEPVR
jgi:two-component system capsular synthesis response regulator RcsB